MFWNITGITDFTIVLRYVAEKVIWSLQILRNLFVKTNFNDVKELNDYLFQGYSKNLLQFWLGKNGIQINPYLD